VLERAPAVHLGETFLPTVPQPRRARRSSSTFFATRNPSAAMGTPP
jgi:hypothetical protein